ncbi:MAG: nucleotidyltransferase family protein [Proteobacteria bacterium]|nr:nucleotidyltransferase family protein [Pseudomonadota bacterium]
MAVVGILLAAGKGERFGGAKLLAPMASGPSRGVPVGVVTARKLVATLPHTVAVVRPGDAELMRHLGATGARVVECAEAGDGMGASLACGVAAAADASGWVVMLADMPWVAQATLDAVATALRKGASIVAPSFRGQRGHPVGFASRHKAALLALRGDTGARDVLAAARDVVLVDVNDVGILRDVDVPDDLHADQQ